LSGFVELGRWTGNGRTVVALLDEEHELGVVEVHEDGQGLERTLTPASKEKVIQVAEWAAFQAPLPGFQVQLRLPLAS
jgi:hypothetical protein